MKVNILVLTYNNYADTAECLRSLDSLDYQEYHVTVVDNGSAGDCVNRLRAEFPDADFVLNRSNLGYAGGNNAGIRRSLEEGFDLVWLLNNDTVVEPGTLRELVEAAEAHPRAGILGSTVLSYDRPGSVEFAGGRLSRRLGKGISLTGGLNGDGRPFDTGFVTGASLLARVEMICQVGMLDERFFLYLEDLDWCLRAQRAGWRVMMVPASRVSHKLNETTGRDRPRIIYYVCRNSLLLCRTQFPAWLPVVLASVTQRYVLNYLGRYALSGFDRRELKYARMGLGGIADFLRGRFGEGRRSGPGGSGAA